MRCTWKESFGLEIAMNICCFEWKIKGTTWDNHRTKWRLVGGAITILKNMKVNGKS